jgi:hypothetical protein
VTLSGQAQGSRMPLPPESNEDASMRERGVLLGAPLRHGRLQVRIVPGAAPASSKLMQTRRLVQVTPTRTSRAPARGF